MPERNVDDADVVFRLVRDRPFDAGNRVAGEASAVSAENADVDEIRAGRDAASVERRHPAGRAAGAGDDAGDVRAVAVGISHARIAGDEADVRDDYVGERLVRGDAGIDHRDADALAGYARDAADAEQPRRAGAQLIGGR